MTTNPLFKHLKRLFHRPRRPSVLRFEVTQQCTNACLFCNRPWKGDGDYAVGQLVGWKAEELLKGLLKCLDVDIVLLTGGDPLLYDGLNGLVDFLHKQGVNVWLKVCGKAMGAATAAHLAVRGVDRFLVTTLSYKERGHDELRGREGAQRDALASIENIHQAGGRVAVRFVATRRNIVDLEKTLELVHSLGVEEVHFYRLLAAGEARRRFKDLGISAVDLYYGLRVLDLAAERYGMRAYSLAPIQQCIIDTSQFRSVTFFGCSLGTAEHLPSVDPVGRLRRCALDVDRVVDGFSLESGGDSFDEAVQSFLAESAPFCRKCSALNTCHGGCRAVARQWYGTPGSEEPFLRLNKKLAVRP